MPNLNPIKVNAPEVLTNYSFSQAPANADITLTIEIDIATAGWLYQPLCQIFLGPNNIYPAGSPEPTSLALGKVSALIGQTLLIRSNVGKLFPAGGMTGAYPKVDYSIIINANGVELDRFDTHDGTQVSSDFNALLNFVA